jgi:hypothetical protein
MLTVTDKEIAQNFIDAIHFNRPRWFPVRYVFYQPQCLVAGISPDVPLENIKVICNTLEEIGGTDLWYKSVWA